MSHRPLTSAPDEIDPIKVGRHRLFSNSYAIRPSSQATCKSKDSVRSVGGEKFVNKSNQLNRVEQTSTHAGCGASRFYDMESSSHMDDAIESVEGPQESAPPRPSQPPVPKEDDYEEDELSTRSDTNWVQFVLGLQLELFLLVYAMSYSMRLVITQDWFLYKACLSRFDYNETICHKVLNGDTEDPDKTAITRVANMYNLCLFLVQFVPAGLLSIFISPFADIYGLKVPLMVATAGGCAQDILTVLTTVTSSFPTFLTVLCAVPNGLTGGLVITCASVYSHAARNSAESVKTVRFAVIITALTLGFQLGMFIGGQIFQFSHAKHFSVFVVSAIFLACCLAYLWAVVPLGDEIRNATRQELIRDLCRIDNFTEGFHAVFRQRPGRNRKKLLLLMVSMWFVLFNSETARNINYYYTKKRYNWKPTHFSNITAAFGIFQLVATATCIAVFSRALRLSDPAFACIGVVAFMVQNAVKAFAYKESLYYLGYAFGVPGGTAAVGISAAASRIIGPSETTKVFSFWTTCESLVPAIGDIISSLLFNAFLGVFPGLPFLVGSVLQFIPLIALIYCIRHPEIERDEFVHRRLT
ncbi:solute carrier family 46 member 3-like [Tropilaelaps mercedesae]|uniref:Solute carrier family 46 member 3-like n=1 Tax=Tropilaelaps mercedesae TaxID=418985 RepID=A0A1V9Y0G3_9ACAR|nr:solute carrier family 46 member 3-like [Tropilaelaps mercedesae]